MGGGCHLHNSGSVFTENITKVEQVNDEKRGSTLGHTCAYGRVGI